MGRPRKASSVTLPRSNCGFAFGYRSSRVGAVHAALECLGVLVYTPFAVVVGLLETRITRHRPAAAVATGVQYLGALGVLEVRVHAVTTVHAFPQILFAVELFLSHARAGLELLIVRNRNSHCHWLCPPEYDPAALRAAGP
jgi:hypothetical protein